MMLESNPDDFIEDNPSSKQNSNLPGPAIGAISSMVDRRDLALEKIYQALKIIDEAIKIAPEYSFESTLSNFGFGWYDVDCEHNREKLRKSLDKRCWNELIDQTRMGSVMNSGQLENIRNDIEKHAPELTLNRAMTTFMDLYVKRSDTFRTGLVDLFSKLTHHYKSNDSFKVGKRIIMKRRGDRFKDLWHYLYTLDGIDPVEVPYNEQPHNIIDGGWRNGKKEYTFKQFRAVIFQNGNMHIWLDSRPDLINKVNDLIAAHYGKTLP